jgi:hypothetical protein
VTVTTTQAQVQAQATYSEFAPYLQRNAGQLDSAGGSNAYSQWASRPLGNDRIDVSWGRRTTGAAVSVFSFLIFVLSPVVVAFITLPTSSLALPLDQSGWRSGWVQAVLDRFPELRPILLAAGGAKFKVGLPRAAGWGLPEIEPDRLVLLTSSVSIPRSSTPRRPTSSRTMRCPCSSSGSCPGYGPGPTVHVEG